MVSRDSLIKYGTLSLILFFVLSSFSPLLFTQSNPTATPTPAPVVLEGSGRTTANVTQLSYVGLAECDPQLKVDELLKKRPGVKTAFYAVSNALVIDFYPSASVGDLANLVQQACGSTMLRSAFLDVSPVKLISGNQTQLLTQYHLRSFASQNGLPYLRGFVFTDVTEGAVVNVTVSGVIVNDALQSLTVQEVPRMVIFEQPLSIPVTPTDANSSLNSS